MTAVRKKTKKSGLIPVGKDGVDDMCVGMKEIGEDEMCVGMKEIGEGEMYCRIRMVYLVFVFYSPLYICFGILYS
jgi:hypothetical protein